MNSIDEQAMQVLLGRQQALRRLFEENVADEKQLQNEVERNFADRALARSSAVIFERLSEGERRELLEIETALVRIARGTYGRCDGCGSSIGRQRLRAIPEARHCIACGEQQERSG